MQFEAKLNSPARQAVSAAWSAGEGCATGRANPLILSVDDEQEVLTILRLFLAADGFEVLTASSGAEALELAEEHLPDLIITDHGMPGMSGLELCRALRARAATRKIPLMIYSGRQIWEAEPGDFDRFVLKPCELDDLARVVRGLLPEAHAQRLSPSAARLHR